MLIYGRVHSKENNLVGGKHRPGPTARVGVFHYYKSALKLSFCQNTKMLNKQSLNPKWIKEVSATNRKADPALVEKVIRALLLLERLVPSFEDLLGDKLTAFAPETTGIPYEKGGKSKSMEIIKQLYDIGNIFDNVEDLEIVSTTFEKFALTELAYREMEENTQLVLDDIFQAALTISTRGKDGNANFEALQQGISQVKAFIFSENYHIEKAIVHVAKAAYLSKLIEYREASFEKFTGPLEIKDWEIEQPFYTRLNKLKKSNPEAFFYWYKIYELENTGKAR